MNERSNQWRTKLIKRPHSKIGLNIRYLDRHKKPSLVKENPSQNDSLKEKILRVVGERNFAVPNYFVASGSPAHTLGWTTEKAKDHILKNWPLTEAYEVMKDINEVQFLKFQGVSARIRKGEDRFLVSNHCSGAMTLRRSEVVNFDFNNIFWEKDIPLSELRFAFGHSKEATQQNNYQNIGLDKVYLSEVERLLVSLKKMREVDHMNDWPNTNIIVVMPKESIVLVLAQIGENGINRGMTHSPILFSVSNIDRLKKFIEDNGNKGLNAIFSLLFSKELIPDLPFPASSGFYATEQPKKTLIIEGQLDEFEIKKFGKETLGRVKRLTPLTSS